MDPVLYLTGPGFNGCMGERALLEEGKTNVKDENTLIAQEDRRREIKEKKQEGAKPEETDESIKSKGEEGRRRPSHGGERGGRVSGWQSQVVSHGLPP